ncbi:hypothetical protein GW626_12970 [Peribacillus muralis]|nr:hypothetical protein [Peribacillus muralis]MCK1991250.1 hypothetical protein [Peribacillus muralis]MCK2011804.1 hypothetical protein [Peribacillus muralis]
MKFVLGGVLEGLDIEPLLYTAGAPLSRGGWGASSTLRLLSAFRYKPLA